MTGSWLSTVLWQVTLKQAIRICDPIQFKVLMITNTNETSPNATYTW